MQTYLKKISNKESIRLNYAKIYQINEFINIVHSIIVLTTKYKNIYIYKSIPLRLTKIFKTLNK